MFYLTLSNLLVAALVVTIHYEALYRISSVINRISVKPRVRILFGVFATLVAHVVEIWIFAFVYYFEHHGDNHSKFEGSFDGSLLDCAYFSFTTYTTLGFGDIQPLGELRFLTGIEALIGLLLITWTASFLFLEMQRHWNKP